MQEVHRILIEMGFTPIDNSRICLLWYSDWFGTLHLNSDMNLKDLATLLYNGGYRAGVETVIRSTKKK